MTIRYRAVPKDKSKSGFYVAFEKEKVTIEAIDAQLSSLSALQEKLKAYYDAHGIKVEEVESTAGNSFCYAWTGDDAGFDVPESYAGGCGVSDILDAIEARDKAQLEARRKEEEAAYIKNFAEQQKRPFPVSISRQYEEEPPLPDEEYIEEEGMDDFIPFAMDEPSLSFLDNTPIMVERGSLSTGTASAPKGSGPSKSTSSTAYGASGGYSKGGGKYPQRRPRFKDEPTAEGNILGPAIDGSVVSIASISEDTPNVVFEGTLLGIERRDTKTEKSIITGSIVDKTNSMRFKKFFNSIEEGEAFEKKLKSCSYVQMQGTVEYDERFERDYVMNLKSLKEATAPSMKREDKAEEKRVELHLHTKMSDKDALVELKALFKTVKEWGHPAVAITDHGVVQTFPTAQALAKEIGVKCIYGVEGYLIPDKDMLKADRKDFKRYHIIILAKDQVGIRNLYKLISISHIDYYRGRPCLPREVIEEHREGLIIGSACEAGELMQAIVHNKPQEEILKIASFYDYLEIQPHTNNMFLTRPSKKYPTPLVPDEDTLKEFNKVIVDLGEKLNKLVVATCDVHYLNPEDKIYREIMLTASGFTDAHEQPDLHLRTTEEMLASFDYLPKDKVYEVVVTNTRKINDMCDVLKPVPDGTYAPKIEGADKALTDMCYRNAEAIYGSPLPAPVQERLDYELKCIIDNGYGVLYYIAHKLVKNSLDNGYLVGSRGSVGSSFAATMAEITEVNPLPPHYICHNEACKYSEFFLHGEYAGGFDLPRKNCPKCGQPLGCNGHEIPFAIFLGFNGDKVPDIDLNFSGDYQAKAHKYTEELFGRDNVFKAGTIGTLADKTAFGYVRKYAEINNIQARNGYYEYLAKGFTGVKNTTGQHPGGIMVCPRDMDVHYFTPIQHPANKKESGVYTTHFDYHSIEGRMTKLDILGHDDPTIIRMLEDLTGVDAKTIPFDDPATLSLFSSTDAIGLSPDQLQGDKVASLAVPECGTKFVRGMLEDSKPQHFSDLVRISGFSHGTNVWLDNAQTLITEGVCKLNEAISTRDDIMNYLMHKGIEPIVCFSVMENVRKGKGIEKKNKSGEATTEYEKTMREGGIPDWFIDSCKKISYLFPRAHAVAYVMMAFRIAWFKINHPLAFYAAYFSIRAKAFDIKIMTGDLNTQLSEFRRIKALDKAASPVEQNLMKELEVSMEMYQRGYRFTTVDLMQSDAKRFKIVDGKLLPPFIMVDALGEKVAEAIVEEREKKPFISLKDLQRRCKVSQTILETLKDIGATGDLPDDEQMSLFG